MTEVVHVRRGKELTGQSTDASAVFLRNQKTWFSQYAASKQTRYEGWYVIKPEIVPHTMVKIIDRITLQRYSDDAPNAIRVSEKQGVFTYDNDHLSIELSGQSGMTIWSTGPGIIVDFDIRGMYQHPSEGRNFVFEYDGAGTLISYNDQQLQQTVFVYVLGVEMRSEDSHWLETKQSRDEARHSYPTSGWVMQVVTAATQLSFGAAFSPEEAKSAAHESLTNSLSISSENKVCSASEMAIICAEDSLRQLKAPGGYYAGLPWFHQFWSRDELITGLGLEPEEQLAMIERYMKLEVKNGELPTYLGSGTTCADGIGWLCLLAREYGVDNLPQDVKNRFIEFITDACQQIAEHQVGENGLVHSGHNATWMDTIGREGFRVEIQAMYALALEMTNSPLREQFLMKVRETLFVNGQLLDGIDKNFAIDTNVRPNTFLAYLLSPDLLTNTQWEECFTDTIAALKTRQGGLASLDKNDQGFQPLSTGENNVSYHQGDEWFFVNGLAAAALLRFSEDGSLKNFAKKLIERGAEEILWQHFLGCAGEIASASTGESWGCGVQGFSAGAWLFAARIQQK